jgi:hypothetical protein
MFSEFNERQAVRFLDALENTTSLRELTLQGPAYEQHLISNKANCRRLFDAITKNNMLESLEIISGSSLEKETIMAIMGLRSLVRLVLKNCIRIVSRQVPQIFQMALQEHPSLTHVELRNICMVGYAPGQEEGVPRLDPILDALASIPNLQHAVLSCTAGTLYSYHGPLHTARCLGNLAKKSTLETLQVQYLRITDLDLGCIAKHMGPNLKCLRLSSYDPTNDDEKDGVGLYELVREALTTTRGVQVLAIEGLICHKQPTSIGTSSRTPLEDLVLSMIHDNHTIKELKIPGLSPATRAVIDMYLCLNRAGRRRLLDPQLSPRDLEDILFQLGENPNAILYALRNSPGLLCTGR